MEKIVLYIFLIQWSNFETKDGEEIKYGMATRVSVSSQSTVEGFQADDVRDGRRTALGQTEKVQFARRRSSSSSSASSSSSSSTSPSKTIAEANISMHHDQVLNSLIGHYAIRIRKQYNYCLFFFRNCRIRHFNLQLIFFFKFPQTFKGYIS